jgi:Arc/MetJ-type ribon-helix-helix transcriptional regulator
VEITLSREQESYVKRGIETGRFESGAQAVEIAFDSLQAEDAILSNYSREELDSMLNEGLTDFEEGRFEPLTHEVFERIKREGRERLRKTSPSAE